MHLKKEQISFFADQIEKTLKKIGTVFKVEEAKVKEKIETVIQKNMDEESAIEGEVKKLMEQYRSQIASGAIDPQKVYTMIKRQVARERKFVL